MAILGTTIAQLTIEKSPQYSYAAVGTNVQFELEVSNTGNVNLDNVVVFDQLDSNLKFVAGSVTINGVAKPTLSVISGINLGTLQANSVNTITFSVNIIGNPPSGIVYNTASAQYSYTPSVGAPPILGSSKSNTIQLNVSYANLNLVKTSNQKTASLGDIITYNINMVNNGNVDILNVFLIDTLPNGVSLVNGSFNVNGNIVNNVNTSNVFVSHSIPAGSTVNVSFKAAITSIDCSCSIDNIAQAKYSYTLPSGVEGVSITPVSPQSTASIDLNISNFKQLSIEEYLQVPCQKPDIEDIDSINGSVDIIKCMVIQTPSITSVEGQKLTNFKLVIHGLLRLTVEYTACDEMQSVHSATYSIPFSSFIILPANFTAGSSVDVNAIVEDIYYNVSDCRGFFTNTTLLLKACTISC